MTLDDTTSQPAPTTLREFARQNEPNALLQSASASFRDLQPIHDRPATFIAEIVRDHSDSVDPERASLDYIDALANYAEGIAIDLRAFVASRRAEDRQRLGEAAIATQRDPQHEKVTHRDPHAGAGSPDGVEFLNDGSAE